MKCISCGSYFKKTPWNDGVICEDCSDTAYNDYFVDQAEIDTIVNPTGKTQAVFYDDRDDDSHGF